MKKILIGTTGSIAAYKTAEIIRLLKKSHYEVRVVMTKSATEIITPMTLQVLSQNNVRTDLFNHEDEAKIDHISLARWPDIILLAPATANIMAKIAHGIADDLLSTICLATDKPIFIAPAMNHLMWKNIATQENLKTLEHRGFNFIAPTVGDQACGENGTGRMAEPQAIVESLLNLSTETKQILAGKTMVITAGPTIERIDPVRFISNDSSGKMGYALAQQAQQLGAKVILVSGKTALSAPLGVTLINIESAKEMLEQVMKHIGQADWFIASAAVSDYTVECPAEQKMKKTDNSGIQLNLVQNPDILASVCALKNKPFTIGFAAETEQVIAYATQKRIRKGADIIAANDVSNSAIGFNSDNNAITLIGDNFMKELECMPKGKIAKSMLIACNDYITKKNEI